MFRAYKYRISPTNSQKELIAKHIGSVRFVYNLALETKNAAYLSSMHTLSAFDLIKQLPDLKKECEWLKEVNSQSLQQSIQNIDVAFKKFFKGAGFPKFKSKHKGRQTFSVPQNVVIKDNLLILPKFKEGIKIVLHRPIKGTIKQCTISKTPTGKYFASILCDTKEECPPKPPVTKYNTLGIDLGIKSFLVTSDGEEYANPKFYKKSLSKLQYTQRKYSKHKGKRTKQRLALIHEKVANQRKDFLQKLSTKLIRENQSIALESLSVKDMLQNRSLAQSIGDAGWGMFGEMLKYKAEWYGNNILQIGRWEPSSKTCSCCGDINDKLELKHRTWTCLTCKTEHDRDVNAAINIKQIALKTNVSGTDTKTQDELPTLVGVLTPEACIG